MMSLTHQQCMKRSFHPKDLPFLFMHTSFASTSVQCRSIITGRLCKCGSLICKSSQQIRGNTERFRLNSCPVYRMVSGILLCKSVPDDPINLLKYSVVCVCACVRAIKACLVCQLPCGSTLGLVILFEPVL